MKRHLIYLASILALLLFVQPVHAYLEKDQPAPDFELIDTTGNTVRLSDFKGQVIVLKLATTWCPTCKQQTEEIEAAAEFLNAGNVVVVDVFLQDTQEMVDEYLPEQNKLKNFISLLDDGHVREAYNVYLIPRLLLVDRQQKVQRDGGLITANDLEKKVQELLDQE